MTISLFQEWTKQSAVLLAWPHTDSDWHEIINEVEQVYVEIVGHITRFESVVILFRDLHHRQHINTLFDQARIDSAAIIWNQQHTNDTWARDFGPITIREDNDLVLLDFTFNGWGNKYPADRDNLINRQLHIDDVFNGLRMRHFDFVLEGGSIDCDGNGTLLTTRHCLLTPTRNPTLDELAIEEELMNFFGVSRILWLSHGELSGDDTDSHIDMLARFCDPATIAYTSCNDPDDEHYSPLHLMQQELQQLRQANGEPYQLVELPIPAAKYHDDGHRMPASYANFLIINDAVLVPVYNDPADAFAIKQLERCFPDREIIAINCLPLIKQSGSLHCITMQLPEGVIKQ